MSSQINKILIANRGEIALRIMKTIRKMGLKSVAIYSDADRLAPHTLFADEAYYVGKSPSKDSYLQQNKIINIAKENNIDAIHPGYGFLSENAEFVQKIKDAGLIFIGPSAQAIETMGDKIQSKETVLEYDIPLVPGTEGAIENIEEAISFGEKYGYPILIKASAGGGGKGMRVVNAQNELKEQLQRAQSEAQAAFGNPNVFIEKYVQNPRHIEFQIIADQHDNYLHLFERECSIQRRHQKVVEEAPSAVLTPELRDKMGKAAVDVARSCNYEGVGTVEFLIDDQNNFYFLEMNTRLQVEHPVTELITGLDLVEWQIHIANGIELDFKQKDLSINGHAIELRVYAEDPSNNFLPDIGKLNKYVHPKSSQVRVDSGYREGMEIPIFYDPLISKLIVYASTRKEAIQELKIAINQYQIEGVKTTLSFGQFLVENEAFIAGDLDTAFIAKYFTDKSDTQQNQDVKLAGAVAALTYYLEEVDKV